MKIFIVSFSVMSLSLTACDMILQNRQDCEKSGNREITGFDVNFSDDSIENKLLELWIPLDRITMNSSRDFVVDLFRYDECKDGNICKLFNGRAYVNLTKLKTLPSIQRRQAISEEYCSPSGDLTYSESFFDSMNLDFEKIRTEATPIYWKYNDFEGSGLLTESVLSFPFRQRSYSSGQTHSVTVHYSIDSVMVPHAQGVGIVCDETVPDGDCVDLNKLSFSLKNNKN